LRSATCDSSSGLELAGCFDGRRENPAEFLVFRDYSGETIRPAKTIKRLCNSTGLLACISMRPVKARHVPQMMQ
jgi:hypothetical protein